jgi:hypothetical protein
MLNFVKMFDINSLYNDNSDEDETITENLDDSRIVKISAIADGTCFIHSILKCIHKGYKENINEKFRRDLAYETRREFIDMLKEPNPNYPDMDSTVKFVKMSFFGKDKITSKEIKGQKFAEFLQVAYGFQYLTYPDQMKIYSIQYFDNVKEFYDYIVSYRNYLDEYNKFINVKIKERPKFIDIKSKIGNRDDIVLPDLPPELLSYIKDMKKVHNNLSRKVDMTYYILMKKLKNELKFELYNPQNFGVPYVQAHMRGETLPKGLYSELPYNCYFFTANSGVLSRFAYYPLGMLPGLDHICKILNETRMFLADTDIIPFIPGILNHNLIVINFNDNEIINDYIIEQVNQEDKDFENLTWIVICNSNNSHFDACGYKDKDGGIETFFTKDHPFIRTILKSKETKGKIDWRLIDKFSEPKINYNIYSVIQLKKMAEEKGFKIKNTMLKNEIVKLLENN